MIQVGGRMFELAYENKNGWNYEAFRERYSDVLDRYDYIVGDWGYNQLRLKGFFREGNPKSTKDTCITTLQDYIQEYCNFGCAYFVLERIHGKKKLLNDAVEPEPEEDRRDETPEEQQPRKHHRHQRDHAQHAGGQNKGSKEAKQPSHNGKQDQKPGETKQAREARHDRSSKPSSAEAQAAQKKRDGTHEDRADQGKRHPHKSDQSGARKDRGQSHRHHQPNHA